MTIDILARAGIDWSSKRPQNVVDIASEQWDLVITVCDSARESCPAFPGRPETAHWSIQDPLSADGDARETAFWDVLNQLGRRIDLLIALGHDRLSEVGAEQQKTPLSMTARSQAGSDHAFHSY